MEGRQPTRRELEDVKDRLMEKLARLESSYSASYASYNELREKCAEAQREKEALLREEEMLLRTLAYHQEPNAPPSAGLLEYKRKKREIRRALERGELPPRKKPGDRDGHPGTSPGSAPKY